MGKSTYQSVSTYTMELSTK